MKPTDLDKSIENSEDNGKCAQGIGEDEKNENENIGTTCDITLKVEILTTISNQKKAIKKRRIKQR